MTPFLCPSEVNYEFLLSLSLLLPFLTPSRLMTGHLEYFFAISVFDEEENNFE